MREALQGADLIDHVGGQVLGRDVDVAPAEAGQVAVGDLRADADTASGRGAARSQQPGWIAGVEAACHIGAGDQLQHLLVVAETPDPETLPEVGVQVDRAVVGGHEGKPKRAVLAGDDVRPANTPRRSRTR